METSVLAPNAAGERRPTLGDAAEAAKKFVGWAVRSSGLFGEVSTVSPAPLSQAPTHGIP